MKMNSNTNNKLNTTENRNDFYLVTIFATIMFTLSCLGALYVIFRTLMQWIYLDNDLILFKKKKLNMNFKLPLYTSCIDLFDNCLSLTNILYTAIHAEVLKDPACKITSMLLWGFATLNLSLYLVIAFATYFRICYDNKKFFKYGKYDYKLWLSVLFISSIFQLINMHNHGARKYWCSGKAGQVYSSITIFCLIIFTLFIILFCYIKVLLKLKFCSSVESTNKRATKKIIGYILVFIIHWIPIVIQNLGRFLKVEHPWLYILKSSGHAMGSVGNAIVYIINEGVVTKSKLNDRNKQNDPDNNINTNLERISNIRFSVMSNDMKSLQDTINNIGKD